MSELSKRCEGRWPSILMALGLLDGKALAHKDTACPICGGKDRFRFSDKGKGLWYCHGERLGGDGIKLVMRTKGVDFKQAARLIEGVIGKAYRVPPGNGSGGNMKPRDPLKSWREAYPNIFGTTVDQYLKGRGIQLTEIEAGSLRFHPALWHWQAKTKWPCMIACYALADGTAITAHQTFIEPDGSSKAPLDKARLFASCTWVAGGGVWFSAADPEHEFLVAEGIETTLSAMRLYGAAAGCAALSDSGIRQLILPDTVRKVRIFADHDALGQGLAAARDAKARWVADGRTVAVSHAREVGQDANDVWLRRLKARVHA
jgi:putative DNA primase/helicase